MLKTLLEILSWDLPAPAILLEEDGDICLDWQELQASCSINADGGVSWAVWGKRHGTDLAELKALLKG